jgi:hypothetical protein
MAVYIWEHPRNYGDKLLGSTYIGLSGVGIVYGSIGAAGLAVGGGTQLLANVGQAGTVGAALCADGDCGNEVGAAIKAGGQGPQTIIKLGHDFTLANRVPGVPHDAPGGWIGQGVIPFRVYNGFMDMAQTAMKSASKINFNLDGINLKSLEWQRFYRMNPMRYTYRELDEIGDFLGKTTFFRGEKPLSPADAAAFLQDWLKLRSGNP